MTSIYDYEKMVEENSPEVPWLAKDSSFWLEVLEKMPECKLAVTANKVLPDDIKRLLSRDEDVVVRIRIAIKRKLPYDVFLALSKDENEGVRSSIAINPKTPLEILESMRGDTWCEVIETLEERLGPKQDWKEKES